MWRKMVAMIAVLVLVGTAAAVVPNADVVRPAGNVGKAYETAVTAKSAEMKSAKVDELKENVKKSSVVMSLRDERGDVGSVQTGIGPASKGDTLGYDDGTAENAWAFYAAGNGWGVKFTPAQYPVNVDGALIYFWGNDWPNPGGNLMDLWIVDDDGANGAPQTVLYSAEGVTITRGDWNYIELPSKIMITEGSFYIFYIQHDDYPNCPGLAIDESTIPPAGTQWEYVNGTYIDTTYDGAWMIRAVVSPGGDPLDPLPPSNLTAYSDYTTPTEITLTWDDPTHYINGDTLVDFNIEIWMAGGKDSTLIGTVPAGTETYTATGLTDGTLYTFYVRAVDVNDSTSSFVSTDWYAGGHPWPAPPQDLNGAVLNDTTVELTWVNPTTQADGTPLDDLAGIYIYVDDVLTADVPTTEPGALMVYDVIVTAGRHTFYVTAYDNETPVHESDPSNVVELVTNVHAGGPDGFGYTFIDSDHPNGPAFEWIDITTTGTPLNLGDDAYTTVQLSFPFPFYDTTYTSIDIQSNGTITFHNDYFGLGNGALPTNAYDGPWDLIAFYWSDQNPSDHGQVYFQDFGTYAVIEFFEIPEYGGTAYNTYEVILYMNGDIVMNYETVADYSDETIGIQDASAYPDGDWYLQYTYDGDPVVPHDSLTIYWAYPTYTHDVGVASITEPVPGGNYDLGATITPVVSVVNNGGETETFDVTAEIYYGGSLLYTSTATATANPDEIVDVTFSDFTVPDYGAYHFVVYTTLDSDENPLNDTLDCYFFVVGYSEDFEATDGGFVPDPPTGAWEWGTPTVGPAGAHSGVNLWGTVLNGEYENNADWSLYTLDYIATQDDPVLTFWHWYDIEPSWDGGNVAISTDGGATWTVIEPEGGYPDDAITGLNGEPGYTGRDATWMQATFVLNGITSGTIFKIRFRFGSDGSVTYPGWYIDDVAGIGFAPYLPDHDVGVLAVVSPVGAITPNNPVDVIATIRNYGANEETFDVTALIYSQTEDTVFTQTMNITLASLSTIDVNFGSFTPDPDQFYTVMVYTMLEGDENPANDTAYAEARTALMPGDIVYVLDVQSITGDNQCLGVEFDGQYFYVTGGNSGDDPNKVYVIDPNGTLICAIDQPSHSTGWGWRDLEFDGDTLYASVNNNVDMFDIDPSTCTLTYYGSFAGPENPNRALALRRSDGHFFTANFSSSIYEFDKTNPMINVWPNDYSIYGAAYAPSTGTVWFSTQEINSYGYNNILYEFDPATGTYTGNLIEFPLPEGWTDGTAGGLTAYADVVNNSLILYELIQGDPTDFIVGIYTGLPGVEESESPTKPLTYSLAVKQNPIHRNGELTFSLPKTTEVNIGLYDASGRLVRTLASGRFDAGVHSVRLEAKGLANGVYFVNMKADNYKTVKKVVILK